MRRNTRYLGRLVVFTDEFGERRIGKVTVLDAYELEGTLGIEGVGGLYVRRPEEVRLAEDREVHQWQINGHLSEER